MGMDVSGLNPTTERGSYFRANLWAWRPIHYISARANEMYDLNLSMVNWGSNDGAGFKRKTECIKLANAIEQMIGEDDKFKNPEDRLYICLGMWVEAGTGRFVDDTDYLNEVYPNGSIMFNSIVDSRGRHLEPAHSINREYLLEWIQFLRECGGFEIW